LVIRAGRLGFGSEFGSAGDGEIEIRTEGGGGGLLFEVLQTSVEDLLDAMEFRAPEFVQVVESSIDLPEALIDRCKTLIYDVKALVYLLLHRVESRIL
jgi:hypothetical protein